MVYEWGENVMLDYFLDSSLVLHVSFLYVDIHCVSKKTGPLLPFAITLTVLVQ